MNNTGEKGQLTENHTGIHAGEHKRNPTKLQKYRSFKWLFKRFSERAVRVRLELRLWAFHVRTSRVMEYVVLSVVLIAGHQLNIKVYFPQNHGECGHSQPVGLCILARL